MQSQEKASSTTRCALSPAITKTDKSQKLLWSWVDSQPHTGPSLHVATGDMICRTKHMPSSVTRPEFMVGSPSDLV